MGNVLISYEEGSELRVTSEGDRDVGNLFKYKLTPAAVPPNCLLSLINGRRPIQPLFTEIQIQLEIHGHKKTVPKSPNISTTIK